MTSEEKLKLSARARPKKRFSWRTLLATAFVMSLVGAVATLIV